MDRGSTDALVVLVSVPATGDRHDFDRRLVESGLCACVHRLPAGTSTYRWQGAIETADETLLVIKTTRAAWPALRAWIEAAHPHDVPEILALPVEAGLPAYLAWLAESVTARDGGP